MNHFKPAGYPSLSPYMVLEDAEASLQFIERVFGGERLRALSYDTGKWRHAEIRVGEAVLMVSDGMEGWPPQTVHLHLYVEDVDAVFARALQAGATMVVEPEKKDDADKRGGFLDPGGISWWVATMIDPE